MVAFKISYNFLMVNINICNFFVIILWWPAIPETPIFYKCLWELF